MADKPALHEATNTSSWVDELYAKRLAKKASAYVSRDAQEESPVHLLSKLRGHRIYLREEKVRNIGAKQSVRAYFLDLSMSGKEHSLSVVHCDYDPRNGRMRRNTALAAVHVAVSPHAFERLYERLRTNGLGDVYRIALRPLSRVPSPTKEQYAKKDMVLHLLGLGVFPVKVALATAPNGQSVPCWGVLTYIDRDPRSDEFVVHAISPER